MQCLTTRCSKFEVFWSVSATGIEPGSSESISDLLPYKQLLKKHPQICRCFYYWFDWRRLFISLFMFFVDSIKFAGTGCLYPDSNPCNSRKHHYQKNYRIHFLPPLLKSLMNPNPITNNITAIANAVIVYNVILLLSENNIDNKTVVNTYLDISSIYLPSS